MIFISWLRKNWINRFSGLKHFNWTALIEWSKPAFFWLSYFNIKSAPHLSLIDHPATARLGLSEVRTDTDGEYRDRAETDLTGDQRPAPAHQSQPQSSVCCFALWWWSLDLPRSRSQHALTSRLSSLHWSSLSSLAHWAWVYLIVELHWLLHSSLTCITTHIYQNCVITLSSSVQILKILM